MILPVSADNSNGYQMVRPQGLILDKEYTADSADSKGTGVGGEEAQEAPLVDVKELDGQLCEISISHDKDYAAAVAIVSGRDTD